MKNTNHKPFAQSAAAAANLWESWLEVARRQHRQVGTFPLTELLAASRDLDWMPPELEAFSAVCDQPPGILLCGGDAELASGVAEIFGFELELAPVSPGAVIWRVLPARESSLKLQLGSSTRDIPRAALNKFLGQERSTSDPITIQETMPGSSLWQYLWLPHPSQITGRRLSELEMLLTQRAAVVIVDDTPIELVTILHHLGQKLWPVARRDLETKEDRERLLKELTSLRDDRLDDIALRAVAARAWLRDRLLVQVADRKRQQQKLLGGFDHHLNTAHHLLSQYRTHWTSGVRSLTETHFKDRLKSPSVAALLDPQKPGLTVESFSTALAMSGLAKRLDEFITDRMADFVAGLTGLAAKIELRQVSLGAADARWRARSLFPRLEQMLAENHVFPAANRKRGGLTAALTGKKQVMIDERKAQLAKAIRLVTHFLVHEFAEWSGALINSIEQGIVVLLSEALVAKGSPNLEHLRKTLQDLDRLEKLLDMAASNTPEQTVQSWFEQVTSHSASG